MLVKRDLETQAFLRGEMEAGSRNNREEAHTVRAWKGPVGREERGGIL